MERSTKEFIFIERFRTVICSGPGRDELCPDRWQTETKSATMKRCPECQAKFTVRQKKARARIRRCGSAVPRHWNRRDFLHEAVIKPGEISPMKLPFGKYKDWDIVDVPLQYLMWWEETIEMTGQQRTVINFEIARRLGDRPGEGRTVSQEEIERTKHTR